MRSRVRATTTLFAFRQIAANTGNKFAARPAPAQRFDKKFLMPINGAAVKQLRKRAVFLISQWRSRGHCGLCRPTQRTTAHRQRGAHQPAAVRRRGCLGCLGCLGYLGISLAGIKLRVHGEHGRDMPHLTGKRIKYQLLRRLLLPLIGHFIVVSAQWRWRVAAWCSAWDAMGRYGPL